ncbi:MAG: cupin [Crocosphaera sp.]|nr:cupin [Crocosphaera sp.]
MDNIFSLPNSLGDQEFFETIINNKNIKIERIISTGQTTPEGMWYDQEQDEWVILLIKAHEKHRVIFTSSDPACIWLAIHGNLVDN